MLVSDIKGEQALDALAEIMDSAIEIMQDGEIALAIQNKNNGFAIKKALKEHKKAVMKILAVLDGADVKTYEPTLLTIPKKLLEILNDPTLQELFQSQGQNTETSFGSATENTEASEQ